MLNELHRRNDEARVETKATHPAVDLAEPLPASLAFLAGGGRATRLILERDWTRHPLGPPPAWPEALKTALSLVLNSPESMILAWGRDDLAFFFNETYFPMLGPRLQWAMGAPFKVVWSDGWEQAKPIIDDAFAGTTRRFVDMPWKLDTDRGPADTWWSFSYSRVLGATGDVAGLFIFTNETTERVLADAELVRAQGDLHRLNQTLERRVEERTAERDRMWNTSPDLMVVLSHEGVYRNINPAWTDVLGYEVGEVVGARTTDFVHPDDRAASAEALAKARSGLLPGLENRFRHRDGSYRWISWVAAPGPTEIFAIGRHITAAKEAEAALRRTEELLRQAQKMEAVGQLTGGLAHDFNNLLAGISGNLELLAMRLAKGRIDDLERYVASAQGAARRAAALTHRLLAFSRRQTLAPKPTDVSQLVADMLDLVQRTVGPSVRIDTVADPDAWIVLVDPPQLESALLNLCINSRDAMPEGGRIVIETTNRWIDRAAALEQDVAEGPYCCVGVTDSGAGMSAEVRAKAFEPFFTTKAIGEGTGLGLSMIYGFAKQSGGHVRIESEVGRGTTVSIFLPRHAGEPVSERAAAHAASERASRGETVLVVDDEPTVRALVVEALRDLGYRTLEAADSAGGLATLRSHERIDLLVTDVGLPGGMDGRQLADAARAGRPALKVLFITGYAENALAGDRELDAGMSVVTKPFSVAALTALVGEMIDG